MTDVLVILMGLLDVIAGTVILIYFFSNTLAMILGIIMILKGLMSFVPEISNFI